MAILCAEQGLLFIMTPRTGCTAIGRTLREQLGGVFVPETDIIDEHGRYVVRSKHSTLRDLINHDCLDADRAASLLKFTCVRNPFDSLVSLYLKKRSHYQHLLDDGNSWVYRVPGYVEDMHFCRNHTFDQWIASRFGRRSWRRLLRRRPRSLHGQFTQGMDRVIRFEELQDGFQDVLRQAGVKDDVKVAVVNRTSERSSNYREYYSKNSRKIVEDVFARELAKYGYRF